MDPITRHEIWEDGDLTPYLGRHGHPIYRVSHEYFKRLFERWIELTGDTLGPIRVSTDICGTLLHEPGPTRGRMITCDPELPPNSMVVDDLPMYLWSDQ